MDRRGRTVVALLAIALAGCNIVFGLDRGSGDDDVASDGRAVDAPIDARNCDPGAPDEDGDGLPDDCDNCPHLFNPEQDNGDGDDLGDVCDSFATHERIVRFDGFATAPADMTLFASAGPPAFVIEKGQLVDNDATPEIDQLARFPVGDGPVTVITRATVHNLVAPQLGFSASVGVWGIIDETGAFPGGVLGEAGMENKMGTLEALSQLVDTGALISVRGADPRPFGSGITVELTLAVGGDPFSHFTVTDTGGVSDQLVIDKGQLRGSDVGLRTHSLGARFDYLLVIAPKE